MTRRRRPHNPQSAARTTAVNDNCEHLAKEPGVCAKKGCGKALTGRSTKWCSKKCATWFTNQHRWTNARRQAKAAVTYYRCEACGEFVKQVEVNHIEPCKGERGWSCHHHSDNLEVLCRPCHLLKTKQQRKEGKL